MSMSIMKLTKLIFDYKWYYLRTLEELAQEHPTGAPFAL
jgi:hypothetical protein